MKISVNLATRPYVELGPFFLRLRLLMGALALLCVGLAVGGHMISKRADAAQARMDALKRRTAASVQEKASAEASMHLPANAAVLDRAHFLNRLFLEKSFSWTAVMMDLETVLPTGVQVTSIEPAVAVDGNVVIRLRVSGDRDRAIQLVRNLEHSKRFLSPRLNGESTLAKENTNGHPQPANANQPTGTEFELLADYNPLPVNEPYRYVKAKDEASAVPAASKPAVSPSSSQSAAKSSRWPKNGVTLPVAPAQKGGALR